MRRRAEVVLTSGKSYVDETYRAPVNAELAVFSRALAASDLAPGVMLISEHHATSFIEAVKHLQSLGFERIQCEFGPTGFLALSAVPSVEAYLSSDKLSGIEIFTTRHGAEFELVSSAGLFIARIGSVAVH